MLDTRNALCIVLWNLNPGLYVIIQNKFIRDIELYQYNEREKNCPLVDTYFFVSKYSNDFFMKWWC